MSSGISHDPPLNSETRTLKQVVIKGIGLLDHTGMNNSIIDSFSVWVVSQIVILASLEWTAVNNTQDWTKPLRQKLIRALIRTTKLHSYSITMKNNWFIIPTSTCSKSNCDEIYMSSIPCSQYNRVHVGHGTWHSFIVCLRTVCHRRKCPSSLVVLYLRSQRTLCYFQFLELKKKRKEKK